jgi:hypothetical protein
MPKVQVKRIRQRVLQIQNAWNEGAADIIEFRNTKKADFDADIIAARAVEDEIEELKARIKMKEDERDNRYAKLDDDGIDIAEGVRGHKDFGSDSALYGAMGFVRKSERKSGLTRKTKTGENEPDDNP